MEPWQNATKDQVYQVGHIHAMEQVAKRLKRAKEDRALKIVERMIKRERKDMDFWTYALSEGFYDI